MLTTVPPTYTNYKDRVKIPSNMQGQKIYLLYILSQEVIEGSEGEVRLERDMKGKRRHEIQEEQRYNA